MASHIAGRLAGKVKSPNFAMGVLQDVHEHCIARQLLGSASD